MRDPRPDPRTVTLAGRPESGLRLADLVAAFSLASDLGIGLPMEHALRSWRIAARLAERMGLGAPDRRDLFYVVTLAWVGCVADTHEVAAWFGDDIAYRRDSFGVERAGPKMLAYSLRHAGAGSSPARRVRLGAQLIATMGAPLRRVFLSHCLSTATMSDRVGLDESVGAQLRQVFTRWDGKGVPEGVAGEAIAPAVRAFHLADTVEVIQRTHGVDGAIAIAKAWRGTQFDPSVVDAFTSSPEAILGGVDDVPDWDAAIAAEPGLQDRLSDAELDAALEAMGDFTDLRSPSRGGHARAVASLAFRAGELARLAPVDLANLRRAGFVHDLGMNGLPAPILEKPGPLTPAELERVRMHAYYAARMLARPAGLAPIGAIASLATERMDGSGYPRGLSGSAIPLAGRILAAADVFQAMREPRPYRAALPAGEAARTLRAEVRAGRLAGDAVDAVLTAAGSAPARRPTGPAGLTSREIAVLVLIARGASNKQVATALGITPRTAGAHVEHIYGKIGASSRSTATLFAMQQGLLDTFEPLEP